MKKDKVKYRINTHLNYLYDDSRHEVNTGEVVTIPDDAYTINEILDLFTRGVHLPIGHNDAYYSDTDDENEYDLRDHIHDLTDIEDVEGKLAVRNERRMKTVKGEKTEPVTERSGGTEPVDSPKTV